MKYIRIIKTIFSEQNWLKKIIIPGLFCLIPVFGILHLIGWGAEILRSVDRNSVTILPEDTISLHYLIDGIKLSAGILLYNIPALILFAIHTASKNAIPTAKFGLFSLLLRSISFSSDILVYVCIFLFVLILPILLVTFIKRPFSYLFEFRRIIKKVRDSIQELLILFAFFSVLMVFAALGATLLIVGVCFTMPLALAIYLRLIGSNELIFA